MRDYAFGVKWIAMNDDAGSRGARNVKEVRGLVSVALLADIFERSTATVAADIVRYRKTGERPKLGVRAPEKAEPAFAETKAAWHKKTSALLKKLAVEMGVLKSDFRVTPNPGGPAIWGDVSLHTPSIYLSVSGEDENLPHRRAYYRRCAGLLDYGTRSPNIWFDPLRLTSADGMRALAREILEATQEG